MRISSALLAVATTLAALGAQAAPLSDPQVQRLMEAAGIPQAVKSIRDGMVKGFGDMSRANDQLSGAQRDRATQVFDEAFSQDAMTRDVGQALQHTVSTQEQAQLMAWYTSPLGRKITALDQQQQNDDPTAMQRGMDALIQAGPARGALYKQYMARTRQEELVVRFLMDTMKMAAHTAARLRPDIAKSDDTVDAALERVRPQISAQVAAQLLANTALRYRQLSDAELKRLIQFESSAPEQHLMNATIDGLSAAVQGGMDRMTQSLRASAPPQDDGQCEPDDDDEDDDDEDRPGHANDA